MKMEEENETNYIFRTFSHAQSSRIDVRLMGVVGFERLLKANFISFHFW